ncbi:MAG: glycosyltransferase family 39 protein [Gammaproteobacteria bacterium]
MRQRIVYSLRKLFEPDLSGWHYLLLFILVFIAFYYGMGSYPLENMNEGLYGEIPREMLAMGSYIVPHLNYLPYLEKPPLLYWLITLSYSIFGISAFSARLIPAISATAICLGLFLFAKSLNRVKAGWLAAMILASSIGFILIVRVLIFDMLLTACFTLSLLFFYLWYEKTSRVYLRLFYLFCGLAFMVKGLLALVLIPAITGIFVLTEENRWPKLLAMVDWIGILLLLITIIPWIALVIWQQPHFFSDFFFNEQVARFFNRRFPMDYHTGPIYFYLPWLFLYLFPWSIFFPILFRKNTSTLLQPLRKFLWLWFSLPLIFFSLSQAKGDYYMVLGVPPLALLMGIKFDEYFRLNKTKILAIVLTLLLIITMILLGSFALSPFVPTLQQLLQHLLLLPHWVTAVWEIALWMLIYSLCAILVIRYSPSPTTLFSLIAGLIIPVVILYLADKQALQAQRSAATIASFIQAHDRQRPVYLYRDYEKISAILFYLQRRLPIIDSQSEDLYFGSHTPQAAGWFIDTKNFATLAQKQAIYIVMDSGNLNDFNHALQPIAFCEIFKSGNTLVLTNQGCLQR